jgi:hypothetical protein
MASSTLRFRARGDSLCQHFEQLEAGIKRFVGRKYLEVQPGWFGFAPTGEAEEVPYRAEYVKACFDGDLWPADLETAKACGVSFDPLFGVAKAADKSVVAAKPAEKG